MFDPAEMARHDAEAARRMPGPDYYTVLAWIHAALRPAVYLEIGVSFGESLKLAAPPTLAIGVDPDPQADHRWRAETHIHRMTSDGYFARDNVPAISLALLDAEHLFEKTLRDFRNVERHAAPGAVALLHDTVPLCERTAARQRVTEFHTGDVWKMLAYFALRRREMDVVTILTPPSGLTMVRGLGGGDDGREENEIAALEWERHQDHRITIPNSKAAVQDWLLRQ